MRTELPEWAKEKLDRILARNDAEIKEIVEATHSRFIHYLRSIEDSEEREKRVLLAVSNAGKTISATPISWYHPIVMNDVAPLFSVLLAIVTGNDEWGVLLVGDRGKLEVLSSAMASDLKSRASEIYSMTAEDMYSQAAAAGRLLSENPESLFDPSNISKFAMLTMFMAMSLRMGSPC